MSGKQIAGDFPANQAAEVREAVGGVKPAAAVPSHYATWLANCNAMAMPKNYRDDLLVYDRDNCANIPDGADTLIFFAVRDCGTHCHQVETNGDLDWIKAIATQKAAGLRCFVWERERLRELSPERWLERAREVKLLRFAVHLRQREKFASPVFHDFEMRAVSLEVARKEGERRAERMRADGWNVAVEFVGELK